METKYNIGDKIFLLGEGKIVEKEIRGIRIETGHVYDNDSNKTILYFFGGEYGKNEPIREEFCFETKQDLLDSL